LQGETPLSYLVRWLLPGDLRLFSSPTTPARACAAQVNENRHLFATSGCEMRGACYTGTTVGEGIGRGLKKISGLVWFKLTQIQQYVSLF